MARNLWKVIQKQEKKIEELESIVAALQMKVSCLEGGDVEGIETDRYKFDVHLDSDLANYLAEAMA